MAPFTLRLRFEDGTTQSIDFRPVLAGEIHGPLADPNFFDTVQLDEEAHTLVWPNGADFDPATLHDWPTAGPEAGTCLDAINRLREIYSGPIGYDYDHIQDFAERSWLRAIADQDARKEYAFGC